MATLAQAVRLALRYAETELGVRNIFGQDVGPPLGGVFTLTQGLDAAWNTPLDERGIVGTAAGLAMMGERSVCEIQFADYLLNSIDLLRLVGNTCWSTRGQFPMPLVLMTPYGAGPHGGIYHSHSVESILTHLPGWKVVVPATARDAFGLMVSAILDDNPVAYLIPKALLFQASDLLEGEPPDLKERISPPRRDRDHWRPRWPSIRPFTVPIGKLAHVTHGDSLTLVTYGRTLELAKTALAAMETRLVHGRVHLVDLRTLAPYDLPALVESARRTRRVLVVNEDSATTNFGEHLLRVLGDAVSPLAGRLVAARHLPGIGLAPALEEYTLPTAGDIQEAVEELLSALPPVLATSGSPLTTDAAVSRRFR